MAEPLRETLAASQPLLDPEWAFHTEMSEILHPVRDLHTNYLLPDPFAGIVACLPFQVEEANHRRPRAFRRNRVLS